MVVIKNRIDSLATLVIHVVVDVVALPIIAVTETVVVPPTVAQARSTEHTTHQPLNKPLHRRLTPTTEEAEAGVDASASVVRCVVRVWTVRV